MSIEHNLINALKSDIEFKTHIQDLEQYMNGSIEHLTFSKASRGLLDVGDIGKITSKADLGDLSKLGTKTDLGDLSKLGSKTDLGSLSSKLSKSSDDLGNFGKVSKSSNELAATASKNIDVDSITKNTADTMKKSLDDVTTGTKNVGKAASNKIDDAADEVKDLHKKAKGFDFDKAKTFIRQNSGLIIAGVAGAVVLSIALAKFNEVNNKPFNITKISNDEASGYIKIEYSPRQTLNEDDIIEITESNSIPNLLGKHKIYDLIDDSSLLIDETSNITLETNGTSGMFIYSTTFGNMFQTVIRDTVGNAAEIANKGILQPVIKAGGEVAKDTLSSIFDTLIPPKYRSYAFWGCIGLIIISILISFFALFKQLS